MKQFGGIYCNWFFLALMFLERINYTDDYNFFMKIWLFLERIYAYILSYVKI